MVIKDAPVDRNSDDKQAVSSSLQLQSIIQHAPLILWAIDRQGNFTLMEGKGLSSVHMQPGEYVGHSYHDVLSKFPELQKTSNAH